MLRGSGRPKSRGGRPRMKIEPQKETRQMKASVLLGAGWENDSLELLWQDAGRAFCRFRRDGAQSDRHAFVTVPSGAERPTVESINRLTHEYELREYVDCAWALRPIELRRERGRTMLFVEYTGGEPPLSHGIFAAGKCDQLKRDIPYATLGRALQTLVP